MREKRKPEDFRAEIEAHEQLESDQLQADGLTRTEAKMAARRAFGNRTRAEERFYEAGRWMFLENLRRDIRFAVRMLAKDPRFTTLAVAGLALGIAVSTAIFTLVHASLAENAVPNAAYVGLTRLINGRPEGIFSEAEYRYFRDRASTLRTVTAESGREHFLMVQASGGEAEEVQGRFETGDFLTSLGMRPAIGRTFSDEEDREGNSPVAVLNYRFWKGRFASDAGVLGRTLTINGQPVTIVGVADARFGGGDSSGVYLPLAAQRLHGAAERWLRLDASLAPGVTVQQAQAEIDVLANALRASAPVSPREGGMLVTPGGDNPEKRKEILALVVAVTIAVSMILLIACSNLANLLLARAAVRQREIGVRLSLGASRARLVWQLLTESLVLAAAAGVIGLVLSQWLAKALVAMMSIPGMTFELKTEPAVLAYAMALTLATGISFGLAPALQATRTSLAQALHGGVAASRHSRRIWSGRHALVIVPLAVSLMLLLGAGVAVRQVQHSAQQGPEFEASHVAAASLRLNLQGYGEARTREFQETLRQRIAKMPGVSAVALATSMPLSNGAGSFPMAVEGRPASGEAGPHTDYNVISPEFWQTLGVATVRGRGFTAEDREGAPLVALVNQELVRRYWPDEPAVGKRVLLAGGTGPFFEVVGVAPDLQDAKNPYAAVRPTVYVPYAQAALFLKGVRTEAPWYQLQFLARTTGDPAALKAAIRQEIHGRDATLRVEIQTVAESLDARMGPLKTMSMLLSALSGLALLMASVGIYAILAYAVSRRTREIGIRTALGAQRREILALVMQRTMTLIAWGVGLGLVGAILLTRIFARKFAKFGELDAVTCVMVSLTLAAFATLAGYLPARKALRVDPAQALRWE